MNINFEAALQLIDLGAYKEAVKTLKRAISEEENGGNESAAIEYTCVLGDLLSNLGEDDQAKTEFDKVLEYCNRTNSLPKKKQIASDFIGVYNLQNRPNTTQTSPYIQ